MAAAVKVAQSRFALLHIDDSDEDNVPKQKAKPDKPTQPSQAQKKKNKKKKKIDNDEKELRSLAFCPSGGKPKGGGGGSGDHHASAPLADQWEEWRKADTEVVEASYERDLHQAMLLSKVEFEQKKKALAALKALGPAVEENNVPEKKDSKKRRKNKEKAQKQMSLEQFQHLNVDKKTENKHKNTSSEDEEETPPPPEPELANRVPEGEEDTRYFERVDNDVDRVLQKEKTHEHFKKHYAVENVVVCKLKDKLQVKEKEITMLRATVSKLEDELKATKERTRKLCRILGQAEFKEKAEMVLQMEEMTTVKDELTEQITSLTADLEKERSSKHTLKTELDKLKVGRHSSSSK